MGLEALQVHLEDLLHKGMPGRGSEERAADGSPAVSSLVSVWLISQVAHAVGKPKLVNLAKVENKEELKSLRGAAKLAREGLDALRPVRVAS